MPLTRLSLNGLVLNKSTTVLGAGDLFTTGKVFYVDGTLGSNGNLGTDPGQPLASINQATLSARANKGDIVVINPGYTQTVTAAAGLAMNKAGVNYMGIGEGTLRPTITYTTAVAASTNVTAGNLTIQNLLFVTAIDNQTAMINVSASDVTFLNCELTTNTATVGAALGILTAATADRFAVIGSRFIGTATNSGTTTTAQIDHESGVDYVIRDSYFTGKMTQSITNTATILRGLIHNNVFVVGTGTKAINMAAASTPMITNNRMNVASGTAPIVAAAGFVAGNTYSAAAGVTAGTASTF